MSRTRVKIAASFYGLLVVAAMVWNVVRSDDGFQIFFHPDGAWFRPQGWESVLAGTVLGILLGQGVVWISRYTVRRFNWSRQMHIEFRSLLGPLDSLDIVAFALFSAVGEELFFRGAMQSSLGIVISSVVFGALHVGPGRKFLPWPFFAVIVGFAFGALFWLTGNLAAPLVAHFVINYQNLHFINRYDPSHHPDVCATR